MDSEVFSSKHLPALSPAVLLLRVIKNYLLKAPASCSFVNTLAQLVVITVEVAMPNIITRSTVAGSPCASGVAEAGLHGSAQNH